VPGIQFEWRFGDESEDWEEWEEKPFPPEPEKPSRLRWRRKWQLSRRARLILVGALGVLLLVVGGTLWVRYRYFQRTVQEEIQAVIDLEAKAWSRGDKELFLSLQDEKDFKWYIPWKQAVLGRYGPGISDALRPARIVKVDPWGDVVWVEVEEKPTEEELAADKDASPRRRVRFYRHAGGSWKHTGSQDKLWGEERERDDGLVHLIYRARDEVYIDRLAQRVRDWHREFCRTLDCPPNTRLTIILSAATYHPWGRLEPDSLLLPPGYPAKPGRVDEITVPSYWYTGLPQPEAGEEEWDKIFAPLRWQMAYALAAQVAGLQDIPDETANQWCLLEEIAFWLAEPQRQDKPPLLRRIVEKKGAAVIPELLRQLKDLSITDVLTDWLGWELVTRLNIAGANEKDARVTVWHTGPEIVYFQNLLELEQDALYGGFQDTFLALQDPNDRAWRARRESELATHLWGRLYSPIYSSSPVSSLHVDEAQVSEDYALVKMTWIKDGLLYRQWAVFRRVDEGWLHTAPTQQDFFWGHERTHEEQYIRVICREEDELFVLPLLPALDAAVEKIYQDLSLEGVQGKVTIEFRPYPPGFSFGGGNAPYLLVLESPLATGVRADGEADESILRQAIEQLLNQQIYFRSSQARAKLLGGQFEPEDMNAGSWFLSAIYRWERNRLIPGEQPALEAIWNEGRDALCTARQKDTLLPLGAIWPHQGAIRNREREHLRWMEACTFVEFLVQRQGPGVIRALLDSWPRAKSTEEWVQAALGEDVTLDMLETEWREYLEGWCK